MRRTIVQPADVSASALAELKTWLAISRSSEDDMLLDLLRASHETCEHFTDRSLLLQAIEERLAPTPGPHALASRPVRTMISAELVAPDGSRSPLMPEAYSTEIDPDGRACVTFVRSFDARAVAVRTSVGMAATWDDLPAPLKQGIVRLAAFEYRDRDRAAKDRATAMPPASVVALWRPWRALRLA